MQEKSSTVMMNNAVDSKKVKDYIYSLYQRELITFERYIYKLGLIEKNNNVDINEVSEYFILRFLI